MVSVIGPVLLFLGLFGPMALAPGLWATLITASVVQVAGMLLRGQAALLSSTRNASLLVYAALVLQLSWAVVDPLSSARMPSLLQFRTGLAAGSLLFLGASALVLLSGWLKLGTVFKMMPTPVTAGIGNGTALMLIWLASQQIVHGNAFAALTAAAMLGSYMLWSRLKVRWPAAARLPNIVVSAAVGLALATLLEPTLARPALHLGPGGPWVSLQLWNEVGLQQIGPLLMHGVPGALALALVMILETFTAIGLLETKGGLRIDANRELIVLGGSNIVSALLGGVPSTASPLRSLANWNAGGRGTRAALVCLGLTTLLLLAFGKWLLAMPAGLVAGLFLLQVPILVNRPFLQRLGEILRSRRWRGAGAVDLGFWITLVISLVGFFGSLMWACFLGVGLSCLAVLRRVSINLTAQWAYLDHHRSRRVRDVEAGRQLECEYQRAAVLRLTGHLFFGNSARLTQLFDELDPQVLAVVIDVSRVHDVDPSGLGALVWLVHTLRDRQLVVVLSGLTSTRSSELRQTLKKLPGVCYCVDLDRGLEVCEDLVLASLNAALNAPQTVALEGNLLLQDLSSDEVRAVLNLSERSEVAQGTVLFYQDSQADGVWLLEQGSVSVLAGSGKDPIRLATFGPGQFFGEMGFVDGKTRSATARADTPLRAALLHNHSMATLMLEQPATALTIMRNIARELSHRARTESAQRADER